MTAPTLRIARIHSAFTAAMTELNSDFRGLLNWYTDADMDADPRTAYAVRAYALEVIEAAAEAMACYCDGLGTDADAARIKRIVATTNTLIADCNAVIASLPAIGLAA